MPEVGFHQARRPRTTRGERLRRDCAWPRPGGILLSLAGASLVLSGAMALSPAESPEPSSALSTTPVPTEVSPSPSASPPETSSTPALPSPSETTPPSDPSPPPAPPLVAGSSIGSAIQELFAAGKGSPQDQALWDISNPNSPLVLANKRHPLVPNNFAPTDLVTPNIPSGSGEAVLIRAEAAAAAERMFAAAAVEGVSINVKSSYRSYDTQVGLYNGYVAQKGVAAADSTSARPGFSEHQTGLAIDIGDFNAGTACDFHSCFAGTAAAQWVAAHGADFGYVVRYEPGEEAVTGYLAEPWHLRYLGVAIAQDMRSRGIHSYETFLGLPGAPGYE